MSDGLSELVLVESAASVVINGGEPAEPDESSCFMRSGVGRKKHPNDAGAESVVGPLNEANPASGENWNVAQVDNQARDDVDVDRVDNVLQFVFDTNIDRPLAY